MARALVGAIAAATAPGHSCAEVLRDDWVTFHHVAQWALSTDVSAGREPGTTDPDRGAQQLIGLYEGLQIQAVFCPDMDLLASYDRAVARLRVGWSTAYEG